MTDRGMNKVVLVTRKTRLAELVYKYNTMEQARFYIEHMGVDFSDGIESDAMEFNSGSEITIGIADKKGRLVV